MESLVLLRQVQFRRQRWTLETKSSIVLWFTDALLERVQAAASSWSEGPGLRGGG